MLVCRGLILHHASYILQVCKLVVCQTHKTVPHASEGQKGVVEPETGPSEPAAEPAVAPATPAPDGTAGQGGDGDLGEDSD